MAAIGVRRALGAGALLALGAGLAACPGGVRRPVLDPPAAYPDVPHQAVRAGVWAEAIFHPDHEEAFGTDLLRRGLLPVALRVGKTGPGGASDRDLFLADTSFDPHLYLQDGTALEWVPMPRIAGTDAALADHVSELSLELTRLVEWDRARPGFLFFRFDRESVRVQGSAALSRRPGVDRELDLYQSVLSFTVSSPEGPVELCVGLKGARWIEEPGGGDE